MPFVGGGQEAFIMKPGENLLGQLRAFGVNMPNCSIAAATRSAVGKNGPNGKPPTLGSRGALRAVLRPTIVSATGGLAVAAITSFVLALIHQFDATIMILIWNLGTAALIAGIAALFGRLGFTWIASRLR